MLVLSWRQGEIKKKFPLKKNDHCMDALRYGVMSRPALENEDSSPVGNILNLPEAGVKDMDYELCFTTPESRKNTVRRPVRN